MVTPGKTIELATSLSVREVKLSHLRCHQDLTWRCIPGMNLVVGANGCGKTTLLESVYMMAHGRSFRQARDPFLLRHGEQRFMIHGQWQRFGPMHLFVAGRRGQTTIRLQGRDIQRRKDEIYNGARMSAKVFRYWWMRLRDAG